jgi:hypothetical protein
MDRSESGEEVLGKQDYRQWSHWESRKRLRLVFLGISAPEKDAVYTASLSQKSGRNGNYYRSARFLNLC